MPDTIVFMFPNHVTAFSQFNALRITMEMMPSCFDVVIDRQRLIIKLSREVEFMFLCEGSFDKIQGMEISSFYYYPHINSAVLTMLQSRVRKPLRYLGVLKYLLREDVMDQLLFNAYGA